ncbi:hypothetical protein M3Y97_00558300 [Aphelenchoides bicaudatus]|nr:hypothetical protein M3Y97_00558300 [Aphelenchoides bicaudatus]
MSKGLIVLPLFLLIVDAHLQNYQANRCGRADHLQCDEICKMDSFFYGNCKLYDGKDFQCQCYPYRAPLDGSVCRNMQDYCKKTCQQKNSDGGGYCYPQSTYNNPRGQPTCACFGKFLA